MPVAKTSKGELITYDEISITVGGNEGAVHRVTHPARFAGYCIKIYHEKKRSPERKKKIEYMVSLKNQPSFLEDANFRICWPVEMVVDRLDYTFLGFLMKLAYPGSIMLSELTIVGQPSKLDYQWTKFDRTTMEGSLKRLHLCVNLASAIYKLHSTGKYVIVDYKPENVLISLDGKVSIIDVDSFQIAENSNVLFHSEVLTPEYKPQESKKLNPASNYIPETWDRFSIAVSFYRIFFGLHPFTGITDDKSQYKNVVELSEIIEKGLFVHGSKKGYLKVIPKPHEGYNKLSPVLQRLFIKAFEDGHTNPNLRPTAEHWGRAIYEELEKHTAVVKPFAQTPPVKKKSPQVTTKQPASPTTTQPAFTAAKVLNIKPGNVGPAKQSPPKKKESYMFWKIATIILIIGATWLYQEKLKMEKDLTESRLELYNLQTTNTELTGIQNRAQNLQDRLMVSEEKANELKTKVASLGRKYPITIKNVTFLNVNEEGNSISSEAATTYLFQSQLEYLVPVITFDKNLEQDTTLTVYYQIIGPEKTELRSGEDSKIKYEVNLGASSKKENALKLPKYYINTGDREREIPKGQYEINILLNDHIIFQENFQII